MKYFKLLYFLLGFALISAGILIYFNQSPELMQSETITIKDGDNLKILSGKLKSQNLIKNRNFFIFAGILSGKTIIKTGNYKIFRGMTSLEILNKINNGDVFSKKITIPEGFNIYQIAERLEANNICSYDDLIFYSFNSDYLKKIGINSKSAEGYLYPDTYFFQENSEARQVISIMHNRLKKIFQTINKTLLKNFNLNQHRLLVLASMIEKEAKVPEERRYISSVFHNRMKKKMKFDCDPTVRYAVKKFTGTITISDINNDSPFNTYRHMGYPPTPICSPGLESIKAVLSPADTIFLYFVARNDGSHYFSKNLKEHNQAVLYYQKGIKNGFIDRQKL